MNIREYRPEDCEMIANLFYETIHWKILIDEEMNKTEFQKAVGLSPTTVAKLGKNETVNMEIYSSYLRLFLLRHRRYSFL